MPAGVVRLACRIRETNQDISFCDVYDIMRSENMVTPSPAKSKRRKWVRYERRYSNAMWHVDWHMIKDSRLKGLNLIVFLDDASRCVTGFGVFQDATSENAVLALRRAISESTAPAQMLSDNGRCFAGGKIWGPKKRWIPTMFEEELLANNIVLITTDHTIPRPMESLRGSSERLKVSLCTLREWRNSWSFTTSEELTFHLTSRMAKPP